MNNAILTNPVPIQINDKTLPTHTDNPKTSTTASQISRSINERVERANNIIVFNLQEQSNETDKNTIINLCTFVVDRDVTCNSTGLDKKEEGKISPVKIVLPDAIIKNYFVKNLNNPPDQFKNLSIKHDVQLTIEKMNDCCKILQMKKTLHQTKIQKALFLQ